MGNNPMTLVITFWHIVAALLITALISGKEK
jgi:hypothetical protein